LQRSRLLFRARLLEVPTPVATTSRAEICHNYGLCREYSLQRTTDFVTLAPSSHGCVPPISRAFYRILHIPRPTSLLHSRAGIRNSEFPSLLTGNLWRSRASGSAASEHPDAALSVLRHRRVLYARQQASALSDWYIMRSPLSPRLSGVTCPRKRLLLVTRQSVSPPWYARLTDARPDQHRLAFNAPCPLRQDGPSRPARAVLSTPPAAQGPTPSGSTKLRPFRITSTREHPCDFTFRPIPRPPGGPPLAGPSVRNFPPLLDKPSPPAHRFRRLHADLWLLARRTIADANPY